MNWRDLGQKVGKFAPSVGAALGGPAGAAVGTLLSAAIGSDNNPDSVSIALDGNPEQIAAELRRFEIEHATMLRTLELELEDVQNARDSHRLSIMPAMITMALTLLNTVFGAALFFAEFPEGNRDMINNFGAQLVLLWVASITYWIGTSRSSAEKTKALGGWK